MQSRRHFLASASLAATASVLGAQRSLADEEPPTTAMSDVRYTREHEWVRLDGDLATVGISDYAQQQLGEVVFVGLPEVGRQVSQGGRLAVLESVKAAVDIDTPISGEVVEINAALADDPGLVNQSAEDVGWFCRLRTGALDELSELMNAEAYKAYVAGLS